MRIVPSYKSGFYAPSRGGVAAHPELWKNCVGAWSPALGPTGSTLFDQGAYKNHGTLTNMDPATDWVVEGGVGALDFDGTTNYISSANSVTGYPLTLMAWVTPDTPFSQSLVSVGTNATENHQHRILIRNPGQVRAQSQDTAAGNATSASDIIVAGTRYCVVGLFGSAVSRSIWLDGVMVASDTTSATPAGMDQNRFGYQQSAGQPFDGRLSEVRIYNRVLTTNEIRTLALRPNIAYETRRRRVYSGAAAPPAATTNNLMLLGVG